jgi:hypothetical protein
MNSLGNHNGPSVGNIGGNISTTGITEYLTKQSVDDCRTLDKPGVYILGEPLKLPDGDHATFGPCTQAGLIIDSSDVTIDLNGFSITYGGDEIPGPPPAFFHGILISPGVRNVTIKNGSIRGFTIGSGISATSTSGTDNDIQQVVLADLMIQNNQAGVTFNGIAANPLKLINITTSTISNNLSYGIKYSYVNTGKLSSVTASENTNSAGSAQGVWLTDCNNIDLFAVDTERNAATSGTGYGVLANACNKINFYYSNANYNTGTTAYGIALTSSNTCKLDSNNANENIIGYYDSSALTTSLFVNNSASKNGSPGTDLDAALVANYNIIVDSTGGTGVSGSANKSALGKFILNNSIHTPQDKSGAGKLWNYSWTN